MVESVTGEFFDVVEWIAAGVGPCHARALQCHGHRVQVVTVLWRRAIVVVRIVDDRRVGTDQHQVVWCRRSSHLGEITVTERVLTRQREIGWDILLDVLHRMLLVADSRHG